MRLLFGMEPEVVDTINSAWDYLRHEYRLDLFPEGIVPTVELCLHSTITELIVLHYMYRVDTEEYLHTFETGHIEAMIESIFEYDESNWVYNEYVSRLENLVCEGNPLAMLIMKPVRTICITDFDGIQNYDFNEMIYALGRAVAIAVCDTLREIDIVQALPNLETTFRPGALGTIRDVDVNLSRKRLTIYN